MVLIEGFNIWLTSFVPEPDEFSDCEYHKPIEPILYATVDFTSVQGLFHNDVSGNMAEDMPCSTNFLHMSWCSGSKKAPLHAEDGNYYEL